MHYQYVADMDVEASRIYSLKNVFLIEFVP
jgi:hypothetical protein